MTVAEVLHRAADILRHDGWVQHEAISDRGCCIVGAYTLATVGVEAGTRRRLHDDVWRAIVNQVGEPAAVWNDRPERTAEEVIAALEAAAEKEEAK